jgi:hypothetical protein
MKRIPAFAVLALLTASCASWRHGSTLAFYQGVILDVPGPGRDRLDIESAVDSTIHDYLTRNGLPDFVYVANRTDLEMIYLKRDTLVHFHRPVLDIRSTPTEVHPVPDPFLDLLPAVGTRLREARAQQGPR